MISLGNLRKEIALIEKEMVILETPKFRGQKEDFPYWISKVDQVFTRYNIDEQEKFKVVIKKLRGHALEWWEKYKYKRKKRGKSKITTWDKLRGKLIDAFAPTSYLHNHPLLSFEVNNFDSSSKNLSFNKGSPMSACISSSPTYMFKHIPLLSEKNDSKSSCTDTILNKGSSIPSPQPIFLASSTPQKKQTPQTSQALADRPNPDPLNLRRCSKCQGFGHTPSDCPNKEFITLAEWEVAMEEEKEENDQEESFEEEIELKAEKEEILHLEKVSQKPNEIEEEHANIHFNPKEQDNILSFPHKFTLTPIQPSQILKPHKASQNDLLLTPLFPTESDPSFHPSHTHFYQTPAHVAFQVLPFDLIPSPKPKDSPHLDVFLITLLTSPHHGNEHFEDLMQTNPEPTTRSTFPYAFSQRAPFHKKVLLREKNENPLSLRTNSKQPGEYDVYFHIHHFYSSSPISWEVKFQQNHEWEHLIMVPLFEFRDERHLKAFLLLFKVPLLKGNAETGTRSTNGEVLQAHSPTLLFPARERP